MRGIHPWPSDAPCVYCEEEAQAAERVRVGRWHATYNAALTGCLAREQGHLHLHDGRILEAVDAANALHGPLVKP